jgi:hypothetical protein
VVIGCTGAKRSSTRMDGKSSYGNFHDHDCGGGEMEIAALPGGVFAGNDLIQSSYIKQIVSTAPNRTVLPCRNVWSEQKQEVFSSRASRPWQHMQWNHFVAAAHWHRVIISVQESLRSMTFSQVMNRTRLWDSKPNRLAIGELQVDGKLIIIRQTRCMTISTDWI